MPRYGAQERSLAVDLVRSYERAGKTRPEAIRAAQEHSNGVSETTLRKWVKDADVAAALAQHSTQHPVVDVPVPAPAPKKKHPLLVLAGATAAVVAFVGTLLGIPGAWRSDPVQAIACPTLGPVAFLGLGDRACLPKYLLVTEDEAADLLYEYYGRKRFGTEELAYAAFAGDPEPTEFQVYEESLETTLISEVMSAPDPVYPRDVARQQAGDEDMRQTLRARQDPNTFSVVVREYFADGRIHPKRYHVRLEIQADGRAAIIHEAYQRREEGSLSVEYPLAYIPEVLDTRRLPLLSSDVSFPASDMKKRPPRHFAAMCEIEVVPDSNDAVTPDDVGWWTRTNQGWIRSVDLHTAGAPIGAVPCAPYVLSRTPTS